MLYFQLSEPEYNSLRRVQDQLGLISSLIIGAYPGHALEPVTPGQLLAFIQAQEEALERSEEHTSELQSPCNLVCRLLLEKKKKITPTHTNFSATRCRQSFPSSAS